MPPLSPDPHRPASVSRIEHLLILDAHADTPQRFADEGWHFTDPIGEGHLNLGSARVGGLSGEFFAIWPEPTQWRGRYAHRTLQLVDSVLEQVRRNPEQLSLCRSPSDILAAHHAGKFAVLMGVEGGHAIENSLALLRSYFELGVRYMTLTWANSNDWADSSGDLHRADINHNNGLSAFGEDVIREMNRLGMMIDVSHVSDETLADVLRVTSTSVLASHSGARSLTQSARNLTDDQIRAIADGGGAVMVNFYSAFIDERWRVSYSSLRPDREEAHAKLEMEYQAKNRPIPYHVSHRVDRASADGLGRPPLEALIDHIDYIAKIAGTDHVGFGSDFDGVPSLPMEVDSAADIPTIILALERRGYGDDAIRRICGGNLLRVFHQVEAHAADLSR